MSNASLSITAVATAELIRQASFGGSPGIMHIDFMTDPCGEGWRHIRLRPGNFDGVPIARSDGITLFAPMQQKHLFNGLCLNYYADLSGGGFLITTPVNHEGCPCGSGFRPLKHENL